jgi:protein O-GlcNAc transferase
LFLRAAERYREYVQLDDRSARGQYKLGLASYRAGQLQVAVAALREAIRLDAKFAEAHYTLGVCLRASGSRDAALASLEKAVKLSPALLGAREELADFYAELGRYNAGLPHLEALVALQPDAARARALGLGYARAGHLDRAVGQLSHAVERYPDDAATYVAVGRVWLERAARGGGRVELSKALQALQGSVNSDSNSEALTLLGRALAMSGDLGRAEQVLEQAAARFPVDPDAFRVLADVAERRGRASVSQRALLDYAALVRSESLSAPLLARIAQAYMASGDMQAARAAVGNALEKEPNNVAALGLKARLQ